MSVLPSAGGGPATSLDTILIEESNIDTQISGSQSPDKGQSDEPSKTKQASSALQKAVHRDEATDTINAHVLATMRSKLDIMASVSNTISDDQIQAASNEIEKAVHKSHSSYSFWQSAHASGGALDSIDSEGIKTALGALDKLRFVMGASVLVATIFERPLWCYDDASFEKYDNYANRTYWGDDTEFLPNMATLALDGFTVVAMLLWFGGKLLTTYTRASDVLGLVVLFMFAITQVIGFASSGSSIVCACATTAGILRLVLLFQVFAPLRTGLNMTVEVIPKIWNVLILVAFFLVTMSCIHYGLLHSTLDNADISAAARGNLEARFADFGLTYKSMFYYAYKNGFPKNMSMSVDLRPGMVWFFIFVTFAGSYFIMPLFFATIVQSGKKNYLHALDVQAKTQLSLGLLAAYRILDTNCHGYIGYATVKALVNDLYKKHLVHEKPSKAQFSEAVQTIDADRDGLIDVKEFLTLCDSYHIQPAPDAAAKKKLANSVRANLTDKDYRQGGAHLTNHFHSNPVAHFFYNVRRMIAAQTSDEVVDSFVELFFEPSRAMNETYIWKSMEDSNPHMGEAMLRHLGWGLIYGPKRQNKYFVAPCHWHCLLKGVFTAAQNDESSLTVATKSGALSTDEAEKSLDARMASQRNKRLADLLVTPEGPRTRNEILMALFSVKMSGSETMDDYTAHVTGLLDALDAGTGANISQESRVTALVKGLPPSLKSAFAAWQRSLTPKARTAAAGTKYAQSVKWLKENHEGVERFYSGDLVRIVKKGSSHAHEDAVVTAPDWAGRVKVRMMKSHQNKSFLPHELHRRNDSSTSAQVLDNIAEAERKAAEKAATVAFSPAEASARAAAAAVSAAVQAMVVANSKNSHLVMRNLDDAIGHHLHHNRPLKSEALYMVSTLVQVAMHMGSIITLSHYFGDNGFPELLQADSPYIILSFLVLLLKYVAGRYHTISMSPDLGVVLIAIAFEVMPTILAPSKTTGDLSKLLTIVIVSRIVCIFWLLTRTSHFFTIEMLLRKALPTLLLVLFNILMCILFANIIGQTSFGGLIWVDHPDAPVDSLWCDGAGSCAKSERLYTFNNSLPAMLLLFVSTFKGYKYADVLWYATDYSAAPYIFFFVFWIFVGLVNLSLFKSILFMSYWGESKRLELANKWLASKCSNYYSREFPADAHESRGKKPQLHGFIWHCLHFLMSPCFGWDSNPTEVAKSLGMPTDFHGLIEPEYEREVQEIMSRHKNGRASGDLELIERQA